MIVGFYPSRAMLSIAMMLFGLNALAGVHPKRWLHQKWWLLGIGWIGLMALSWFWSDNSGFWSARVETKLAIVLLPLAFAFTPRFDYRAQKIFTIALCLLLWYGTGYTMYFLISHPEHYIQGYSFSHVLPTLPEGDHIVYSLSLVVAIVWGVYFLPLVRERLVKVFLVASIIVFILALHIVAVRTGLLAFYVFVACWCLYLAARRSTRWIGIGVIAVFIVGAVLAMKYVPTLRQRVAHTMYTYEMYEQGNISADYSDMGRIMSYDIALRLMKEHPLAGVGAGDILDKMKEGYDRWHPHVKDEQRLVPHNQFLTIGVAIGIPGLLLFIAWLVYPLFTLKRNRAGAFFVLMWIPLLVPLMVEPFLEIQFGVFIYLFFLLWQRHIMKHYEPAEDTDATPQAG